MPADDTAEVDPVRKADQEAQFHAKALAFGLHEPEVWDLYWKGYLGQLKQEIRDHFNLSESAGEQGGSD